MNPCRIGLIFYATHVPREKLKFLDAKNPLVEGVVEDAVRADLDAIVERFKEIDFDIYAIDCAPACFQDKNVVVTRAFSPQLYPLQFVQEDVFALVKGSTSSCGELPPLFPLVLAYYVSSNNFFRVVDAYSN